jgi:parallel beta helix pectate lyase-like protein
MKTLIKVSAFLVSLLFALPAFAAARTFVASTGVDTNPCSLVAPCRSLQAGVTAVDPGGEVVVLDSAGYGPMAIAKAVQVIVPPGVHAGITATALNNAVDINAGANDVVVLRGLYLDGTATAANGILFSSGKALHVENCVVNGFPGIGLFVVGGGFIEVKDTVVRENGFGIAFILSSGAVFATLDRVRLERNVGDGLRVEENVRVTLRDSVVASNSTGARVLSSTAAASAQLTIVNSVIANNTSVGVHSGAPAIGPAVATVIGSTISNNITGLLTQTAGVLQVSNSAITHNALGVSAQVGSTLVTMGTNTMIANTLDGVFTGTFLPK